MKASSVCRLSIRNGLLLALGVLVFSLGATGVAYGADYVVTTTNDTNDGACDGHCSLREAIIAANADAGPDTITLGPGVYSALWSSGWVGSRRI